MNSCFIKTHTEGCVRGECVVVVLGVVDGVVVLWSDRVGVV